MADTNGNNNLTEYQELLNDVRSRTSGTTSVYSLLFPGSLIIVGLGIANMGKLDHDRFFGLSVEGYFPLVALIPIALAIGMFVTTRKLDDKYFEHIRQIENELNLTHRNAIYDEIKNSPWYSFRQYIWLIFFIIATASYILAAVWLFTRPA